jgi:hypothetical protein
MELEKEVKKKINVLEVMHYIKAAWATSKPTNHSKLLP